MSDDNGGNFPSTLTAKGNCYWKAYSSSDTAQLWTVETVSSGNTPDTANRATQFPVASYYNASNNGNYPNYVGECTWYCCGRFHEVCKIKNVGYGNAYEWVSCRLPDGVSRDTGNKTPRANSIAVFGAGGHSPMGHVVFIESVSGSTVTYSDANGANGGGTFAYSNGQIEVRNSQLTNVRDGYKTSTGSFRSAFGSGLTAIIYKN
ncbi:MAG: CHAP domain-containing protein [Acetanaerobacterium sp.]